MHDLFQLWERAKSLAYPELTLKPPMSSGTNGGAGEDVVGKQTDEDLRYGEIILHPPFFTNTGYANPS